ncbi:MAG: PA-phosphatase [Mucilaginibacter sp.]|nr:PA-phosphatase [Mucilaginibacter sp.]
MKKPYLVIIISLLIIESCKKDVNINNNGNQFLSSKPAKSFDGAFIRSYYDLTCKIVKGTPGFFPPQASRAYAYISIASYESAVPGISSSGSLAGQLNGLSAGSLPKPVDGQEYNWAISSNAATSEMIRRMFEINITKDNATAIDNLETQNKSSLSAGVSNDVITRSEAFGKSIAAAIYNYSKTDGGYQSYLDPFQLPYTLPTGPDQWVPTGPVLSPVSPKWGANRPFITADIMATDPPPCYPFSTDSSSLIYKDAMKVYVQVKHNTTEQINITKFWADDPFNTCTPTGHTLNILSGLLDDSHADLAKTVLAYAHMGVAENDAFIACWKCKYKTNLLRPVTYINRYIDASFTTVIGTPPFPAYVSGHSVEIGAGDAIFTMLFTNGDGIYPVTDRSQVQYGFNVRSWKSFDEMAKECADSRFYGGIHFQQDNQFGLEQGKKIGTNVNTMIQWPQNI